MGIRTHRMRVPKMNSNSCISALESAVSRTRDCILLQQNILKIQISQISFTT